MVTFWIEGRAKCQPYSAIICRRDSFANPLLQDAHNLEHNKAIILFYIDNGVQFRDYCEICVIRCIDIQPFENAGQPRFIRLLLSARCYSLVLFFLRLMLTSTS